MAEPYDEGFRDGYADALRWALEQLVLDQHDEDRINEILDDMETS